jgi:aerobic-type carbon monoxide dehydrogenase small subunit (CoxS/CutS family)
MNHTIELSINGQKVSETVDPSLTLANYLAEHKNLTATRVCCGIGICRACTVAVKRKESLSFEATRACITPVISLDGADIKTTEGLAVGENLHPLQTAFLKHFSFQCGYSTSGFLMGAFALLDQLAKNPISQDRVDQAILDALGDHICRCTGYFRYFRAIKEVILKTPGMIKGDSP